MLSFTAALPQDSSSVETKGDGIDVSRLAMLPVEADEALPDNIKVIDFRQPAEAKIIRLPVPFSSQIRTVAASESDSAQGPIEAALPQLPGESGPSVEFAHLPASDTRAEGAAVISDEVRKPVAHAGLPPVQAPPGGSAEATGITAARQEFRMDSLKHSEDGGAFATREPNGSEEFPPVVKEFAPAEVKAVDFSLRNSGAMDWHLGRPVSSFDRPSLIPAAPLSPEQSATVERISTLMVRETSLVRQYSSDSMAVVLRPDDGTELYVHFSQRNGQIEATIRCDRGDAHQLGALWPQLQESLAQQRVRLAPLQEGSSGQSNFNHSSGSGPSGEGSGSQRRSPSEQSMDERSAPASSIPDIAHVRGRGGSRRRLTTSRPGWETWA